MRAFLRKILASLPASVLPEKSFLVRWLRKLPILGKLHVFTALIGLMTLVGLALIIFGMNTLSGLRAQVVAAGRWSEAQRAAVYSLLRYTVSYDGKDYQNFTELMGVVSIPKRFSAELAKRNPQFDVLTESLGRAGGSAEEFTTGLTLFYRFRNVSGLERAFEIWADSDAPITKLENLGSEIHAVISEAQTIPDRIDAASRLGPLVVEVDAANTELSRFAADFSRALEEASKRIESILMKVLLGTIILFGFLALLVAFLTNRMIIQVDKAKSEFVSLVSHQLRTPLAIIKWYGEKLLKDFSSLGVSTKREYLGELYQATERMSKLVDDVLSVSRIELGHLVLTPERVNLPAEADQALAELAWETEQKKLQIIRSYDSDILEVRTDRKILEIILQNLIANAVHYTPGRGTVEVGLARQKSSAIIKVADTGCGIPADQQSLVFSKLFRARNVRDRRSGSGLGLYIVKSLVDQIGGSIWFESKENYGTTFFVRIPLWQDILRYGKK